MSVTSSKQSRNHKDISRFKSLIDDLKRQYSDSNKSNQEQSKTNDQNKTNYNREDQKILIVSIAEQRLYCLKNQKLHSNYSISTAEAGIGNKSGSYQTPIGIHRVAEKIGDKTPIASIFKARKNTQSIAEIILNPSIRSNNDNITSRILWLAGLEDGVNKGVDTEGNNVDSYSRYIYIHGTDEEGLLGKPASHGCIRMANQEIIDLFDIVENGTIVAIVED